MVRFPSVRDESRAPDSFRISWIRQLSRPERLALELDSLDGSDCMVETIAACEGFDARLSEERDTVRIARRFDCHRGLAVIPHHGRVAKLSILVSAKRNAAVLHAIRYWADSLDDLFETLYEVHLNGFEEAMAHGEGLPSAAEVGV